MYPKTGRSCQKDFVETKRPVNKILLLKKKHNKKHYYFSRVNKIKAHPI